MLTVAVVDDHNLFRKSLIMLMGTFKGVEVVLEAENGKKLLEILPNKNPDIILLDIEMPEMDGFSTCCKLRQEFPEQKILIVSEHQNNATFKKIIEAGAHGYFSKKSEPKQLEHAIWSIVQKGYYFDPEMGVALRDLLVWDRKNAQKQLCCGTPLTKREIEIIKMAGQEKSSNEIAALLFINVRTVETHRQRIMKKTNSRNFFGSILYALKNRYLMIEDLMQLLLLLSCSIST
ncbi:response regulator [Flavobacterium sp.]|uniref:response regulator transcription factor n=1 Tax=Flavobacterium sp. TaxID=239 RepID=UPI0039E40AA2